MILYGKELFGPHMYTTLIHTEKWRKRYNFIKREREREREKDIERKREIY